MSIICLAVVLVLKDSLRTYFKSLSLSWSLGVRSLSLSLGSQVQEVLVLVLGGQVFVLVLVLGGQVLVLVLVLVLGGQILVASLVLMSTHSRTRNIGHKNTINYRPYIGLHVD